MRRSVAIFVGVALGFTAIATVFLVRQLGSRSSPEEVAQGFFHDTYTRNFSSAWGRVSAADQLARSEEEYLATNLPGTASQTTLLNQLAEWGDFQILAVASSDPSQAIVSARIRYPNTAHADLENVLNAASAADSDAEALLAGLIDAYDSGELPFVEGDISFDLVLEDGRWRLLQHWGHSIAIMLAAVVSADLPWDFYPAQSQISAVPGELVKATYIARNNSNETITAKAIHEVGPVEAVPYFQTVQCFCFTEQTLDPGEEREMSLVFRIDPSTPQAIAVLTNRYTFYTLEGFPAEG